MPDGEAFDDAVYASYPVLTLLKTVVFYAVGSKKDSGCYALKNGTYFQK